MRNLSFKDFIVVENAFLESELNENAFAAMFDAVKKKLGGKFSDEEIKAQVQRAQDQKTGATALKDKTMASIAKTKQSKEFHARRAEHEAKFKSRQPKGTSADPTKNSKSDAEWNDVFSTLDKKRAMAEETLVEAKKEFIVTYVPKAGGARKKATLPGRDIRDIRRKFADNFYGAKVLTIVPAPTLKVEEDTDD